MDYDLSRDPGEDVGTYAVTVTGDEDQGNYAVSFVPGTLSITPTDLSEAVVSAQKQAYTGAPLTPAPTVTLGDKILVEGVDYEVTGYADNVAAGTASVRVRGIGNYKGSAQGSFAIAPRPVTEVDVAPLSPLTYKTYISQAKMRFLAPDIAKINEKYPNPEDAMKKQQKTMELYRLAGANPMGGCLPMMLQMPILIAMFTFFPSSIELRGQSFLWANDLSAPDKIVEWSTHIPFISSTFGNHISLFCLLMTVTNLIYTYITMKSQNQSQSMPGMKWMMYLMPLMFLVFFNNYASGLSYYYFISLLITILQTYSCRLFVTEDKVRATMAANASKPKKKSKWMQRLEEAQKMQQQQQRAQQQRQRKRR